MKNVEDKKFTLNGKTVWLVQSKPAVGIGDSCNECVFDYTANEGEPGACPYNEEHGRLECTIDESAMMHFTDGEQQFAPTLPLPMTSSALNIQVGGGHYKDMRIQPVEYIHANNLSFLEGNVVKYITRHKTKNKAQDIRKIIHYCTLILQLEYNETYNETYNQELNQ